MSTYASNYTPVTVTVSWDGNPANKPSVDQDPCYVDYGNYTVQFVRASGQSNWTFKSVILQETSLPSPFGPPTIEQDGIYINIDDYNSNTGSDTQIFTYDLVLTNDSGQDCPLDPSIENMRETGK